MTTFGPKGYAEDFTTLLLGSGTVEKGRGVVYGADDSHCVRAGAAAVIVGVSVEDETVAEKAVPVAYKPGDNILVEAGAAFANNAKLTTNASGQFITAVTGNPVCAVSRKAATAAGQYVPATLVDAKTAPVA